MDPFLHTLTSPPAVVFTVLLGVCFLYWLMVIFGALDLDLFHLGDHGPDAGHGHGADGHGADGHAESGFFHEFLSFLSVTTVPVTIVLSVLVLVAWVLCMLGGLLLTPLIGSVMPSWLWAGALGLGALVAGVPMAALAVRPLRSVFRALNRSGGVTSHHDLIGRSARITSVTADAVFGTAICTIDGAEIIIDVRVIRPELRFAKDDVVVIASYDDARGVYLIGALPHETPQAVHAAPDATTGLPTLAPPQGTTPAPGESAPQRHRPTINT